MLALVVIPSLPDFHARYSEVVLEIGFTERMVDRVCKGMDCMVRAGGAGDSALIARSLLASLAVNHGESCVVACKARLGIVPVPHYYVGHLLAAGNLVELLPQHPPTAGWRCR
ncbi:hypothetical protein SAMN04244572_01254 [Azotobacter beijerinckii]|uniref:LysR substrate binding domain-containing protein n=1 Tax=Azotobacter beijerinckii TaxID=170623 RepID=A0A1H6SPV5_9GAMM|nr:MULTISPECIES: hypothetical protein [Azotobacter]SEI66827.1 hypothetical protein SAMN04244572_01254 [Azotobacter beijerinckii]